MVQLEELQKISETEEQYKLQTSTLLKKWDIPLHHLDFSYIETCKDGKELEKILQILRSGEEGYYPDLIKSAERKLAEIKPNSRYIRKLTPVLTKESLRESDMKELSEDLKHWLGDITKNNEELQVRKMHNSQSLPKVRKTRVNEPEIKIKNSKRISSTDYASWDKYDVDTEILKMDLEDEKLKKEATKVEKPKKEKTIKFSKFPTQAEAIFEANRQKEKGNECFKAGEYKEALQHYTISIECFPSATLYTNKAITHIKLKNYKEAISDCEEAFRFEPNNLKAHVRLAQSYEALNKHQEALFHAEKAIQIDPNNYTSQKIAENARKVTGNDHNGNFRFKIEEIENKPKSILKRTNTDVEIIPIPGTSKMNSPYYKTVYSKDPKVITKEKQMINNRPQPLFLSNIDATSDEEGECLENHLQKPFDENFTKPLIQTSKNEPDKSTKEHKENISDCQYAKINFLKKETDKNFIMEHDRNISITQSKEIEEQPQNTQIWDTNTEGETQTSTNNPTYKLIEELEGNLVNNESNNNVVENLNQNLNLKHEIKNEYLVESHKNLDELQSTARCNRNITENNVEDNDDIRGGGEPHVQETNIQRIPTEIHLPYTFIQTWQSVRRDDTYSGFANIIRNLNMDRIPEVIGNKIDATILSDIFNCLYIHFTVASEVERVYNALINLCRLERFGIVIMFLSKDDKRLVHNLVDFLKQHGYYLPQNVKIQYGLK